MTFLLDLTPLLGKNRTAANILSKRWYVRVGDITNNGYATAPISFELLNNRIESLGLDDAPRTPLDGGYADLSVYPQSPNITLSNLNASLVGSQLHFSADAVNDGNIALTTDHPVLMDVHVNHLTAALESFALNLEPGESTHIEFSDTLAVGFHYLGELYQGATVTFGVCDIEGYVPIFPRGAWFGLFALHNLDVSLHAEQTSFELGAGVGESADVRVYSLPEPKYGIIPLETKVTWVNEDECPDWLNVDIGDFYITMTTLLPNDTGEDRESFDIQLEHKVTGRTLTLTVVQRAV